MAEAGWNLFRLRLHWRCADGSQVDSCNSTARAKSKKEKDCLCTDCSSVGAERGPPSFFYCPAGPSNPKKPILFPETTDTSIQEGIRPNVFQYR